MLVDVVAPTHVRARIADHLPSDQVGIAAVHRVAEHAFDRMLAQESKEVGGLDGSQPGVLVGRWQVVKVPPQQRQSFAIDFARCGLCLDSPARVFRLQRAAACSGSDHVRRDWLIAGLYK